MSELVVYSTGVTVPSAWLNSALLREEGLASYVVYSVSGTVYAKALIPAGTNYSGTDGANGTTAISNAIAAMSAGQKILFRQGTYSITAQIPCAKDIIIELEQGATFKWTAAAPGSNTAIFVNSASINLVWIGGTIDQNAVANTAALGFGSSFASNPAFALKSAVVRNLNIINVHNDGLMMNNTSNTDCRLIDVFVQKEATGTNADTVELDGTRCDCVRVRIDQANIAGSAITSAYLRDSVWDIAILNNTNTVADIGLQAFTGPTGPYFNNVDIYARGGDVELTNGNLSNGTLAGQNIRLHGRKATVAVVGTNPSTEVWRSIQVDGQWTPSATPGKQNFAFNSFDGLILNCEVDCVNVPGSAGVNGVFYCTSTNSGNQINDYLNVPFVRVKNVVSGAYGYALWAQGTLANKTQIGHVVILGGDISENNVFTNTPGFTNFTLGASAQVTVALNMTNVQGFNPQAASNVTAGASIWTYTNNDGYNEIMVLNNLNGGSVSAISYRGDAGYPTAVNGFAFWLEPGQTIAVTWATTAPTFRKYPQ